jgi:hypothetical protein
MLVVDSKEKLSEGKWRVYAPGVKVKIRPLSKRRMSELRREAVIEKEGIENGRPVIKKEIDPDLLDRRILRAAVEDWEGIVDENGGKLPVTLENVDIVMENFNQLSLWVSFESGLMAETIAREKGLILKNSKPSHDSGATGQKE